MTPTDGGNTVLIAGADPFVAYYTRSRLEMKSRTPATPASVYALAVNGSKRHEGVSPGFLLTSSSSRATKLQGARFALRPTLKFRVLAALTNRLM